MNVPPSKQNSYKTQSIVMPSHREMPLYTIGMRQRLGQENKHR